MTATDERTKFMQRLEHGYMLINEANDAKEYVKAMDMTTFWLGLNQQYEQAVERAAEPGYFDEWRANRITNRSAA